MATTSSRPEVPGDEIAEEPIPAMQQILDNPFLLLFIGVATPTETTRPSETTRRAFRSGGAPVPSTSVAPRMAIVVASRSESKG